MSDFDPSARYIPHGLSKPCAEAIASGWTAKRSGSGWMLRSPKRTQKFHVPSTTTNAEGAAKRLRNLITKAYLEERSAFEPEMPEGLAEAVMESIDGVFMEGATVRPGPVPTVECNDCDGEWTTWEGFAGHQKVCLANVAAAMAAEHVPEADPEPEEVPEPSEGQEMHDEIADLDVESGSNGTKMVNREETVTNVGSRQRGYTWTKPSDGLHRALYEAIYKNKRWKDETDTKWSKRLADFIENKGLLEGVVDEPTSDAEETLSRIRELLGGGEIDNLREQLEQKTEEAATLRENLRTIASFAKEEE